MTKKSIPGYMTILALLIFVASSCSSCRFSASIADTRNLVHIEQNPATSSQFLITPANPVGSLNDLDFTTPHDRAYAETLVNTARELSRTHGNADFRMHIFNKNGQLSSTVTLYPASTHTSSAQCPFCPPRKLKGALIAENATTIAFEKSTPARKPIDFLIVPKRHVVNYKDRAFTPEIFIEQLAMAQQLARRLTDPESIELFVNNGAHAAQTVFHSHMHVNSPAQWADKAS